MTRINLRLATWTLACTLFVTGCGGTGDDESTTTSATPAPTATSTTSIEPTPPQSTTSIPLPTTTTPATAAPTTTAPPTTTSSTVVSGPEIVAVSVSVKDGEVSGPGRVSVPFGAQIQLTVTSDEPDEVHFHGYDVFADVAPGAPARIVLVADIPGVFEVELEGRGLELLIVEVK